MPGTVKKKKLTIKTTAPTVTAPASGEEGDASQQAAPAQAAGAPVPPPPMAAASSGGNYKVSAILAIVALILFGALIAIQFIELDFYAKPTSAWTKPGMF